MSLISMVLIDQKINFPCKDSRMIIEDNVGDDKPIHIHFGQEPGYPRWKIRIVLTYNEFIELCQQME